MAAQPADDIMDGEWLEADGRGGFASGTVAGIRTRRYHALLLVATTPPTGRVVLVNGIEAWVETASGPFSLSTQRYAPDVVHPDGAGRLLAFEHDPWPRWTYRLEDGTEILHDVIVAHEGPDGAADRGPLQEVVLRCLFDVVYAGHEPGHDDPSIRPNQVLAVGGLPVPLLDGDRARSVVDVVERGLLTPLGLRSLGPTEPAYRPHYGGGVWERDSAYHQGTAWPWLIGPFVEAWLRVRGGTSEAAREVEDRFLAPLRRHLVTAGLGHVSEVTDAELPHMAGGCPFQAWSLAELLRATRLVEATRAEPVQHPRRRRVGRGD